MSPCGEFGFPLAGFAKARQAWTGCGCAARSIGLNSMRVRQTRRRPKIAAAFCEPNSPHCRGRNISSLAISPFGQLTQHSFDIVQPYPDYVFVVAQSLDQGHTTNAL